MITPIETFEVDGLTVKIYPDGDADSPRDWDNLGKMVFRSSRYNPMGDDTTPHLGSLLYDLLLQAEWCNREYVMIDGERMSVNEFGDMLTYDDAAAVEKAIQMLDGLYLVRSIRCYSHGYTTIRDLGNGWEPDADGWIFVSRADVLKEYSSEIITAVRGIALACLKGEIETYDQFLTGDVYGYVIEDADGEQVDGCCGFYGLKFARQDAEDAARAAIAKATT